MKKNFSLSIILFGLLIVFAGCKKVDTNSEEFSDDLTVKVLGNVEIPVGVSADKIGKLEIISGFYTNTVTSTPPDLALNVENKDVLEKTGQFFADVLFALTSKANAQTGNANLNLKFCAVQTFPNTFQIHSITNDGQPFMYGFSMNVQDGNQVYFNTESTAVTLLLISPYLNLQDPNNAPAIIEKIKQAPLFIEFKNVIGERLLEGSLNKQSPYIDLNSIPVYKRLIVEILASLRDNSNINQNGLEIFEKNQEGNELTFKIRNYKKRYLTVYAHHYKDGVLSDIDVQMKDNKSDDWLNLLLNLTLRKKHQLIGAGTFDWVEAWRQIFSLNIQDQITQESETFTVDTDNADKIFIRCYGLGFEKGDFPNQNSEDFKRGIESSVFSAVFDIVKPTLSMIFGFKDFGTVADLRGRPNNDPVKKLINKFTSNLANDKEFYNDISLASFNRNYKSIFGIFYDKIVGLILDEDNAKLYLDIMKKNSSNEKVLEAFKTTLKGVFKVQAAADLTGTSVNLAEAVTATLTSNWTTEFIIDVNNSNPEGVVTDPDGYKYSSIQIGNQKWTTENYRYGGIWWKDKDDYGGYYNSDASGLPENWRLPTGEEFQELLNKLGTRSQAYDVLTSSSGFYAKPFGYIRQLIQYTSTEYENSDFNNKAIFLSSSRFSDYGFSSNICLVVDFNSKEAYLNSITTHSVSYGPGPGVSGHINVRLIRK